MRYYKKIPLWENQYRIKRLVAFREQVVTYFNNTRQEFLSTDVEENQTAKEARREINLTLREAHSMILASGTYTVFTHYPAPAVGGYVRNVDIILNMFIPNIDSDPTQITDIIERAIGVYNSDSRKALIRTFNPFFWIGLMLDYIASIPFAIIGQLGFNRYSAENSFIGRLLKVIIEFITIYTLLVEFLERIGYLNTVKIFTSNFL